MMKKLFSLLLVALLVVVSQQETSPTYYPFIPPLTHSAQLSLSTFGTPFPPPLLLLPEIQQVSGSSCQQCALLREDIRQETERAKHLRIQMQRQLDVLIENLPEETLRNAVQNRALHSEAIGELKIWRALSTQE